MPLTSTALEVHINPAVCWQSPHCMSCSDTVLRKQIPSAEQQYVNPGSHAFPHQETALGKKQKEEKRGF